MITLPNGEAKVGEWKNDKRIKWIENQKNVDNFLRNSVPEFRNTKDLVKKK